MLALTGTADKDTQKTIISSLALKDDCARIYISPDRSNLRISVIKKKKATIFKQLDWLIEMLKENGQLTPKNVDIL